MDHTNQMFMIAAMGGMVLMVVLLAVQYMKKRKQNQLRGSFSQTYGVSLPDQCIVRQLPEDSTVNTLILAYPYVDGSQGSHTSTGSGYFIGGTSYPMSGGPSAVTGTTTGNGFYSGTSFGSSTVRDNVKQPLSELRICGYLLGFNDPFTAYKTTLELRSHGVEIHPCMEETAKVERVRDTGTALTNGGGDARNGLNDGDADPDLILTPNDIMSFIDPRFKTIMAGPYRSLMDYEARRGLI